MARATATDIARIFGKTKEAGATMAPSAPAPLPQPSVNLAAPAGGGSATSGPSYIPEMQTQIQQLQQKSALPAPTAATQGGALPPTQGSFPTQIPPIPTIGGGAAGPSTSTFERTSSRIGGGGAAPQADPNAAPVDEQLEASLRERAETGGLGSFGEFIEGRFGPEAELIDRQFKDAEEKAARDLARRGILSSGEAAGTIVELRTEQGLRKASLLGILNSEYNQLQQQNINQALNQLGVLQQGKVSSFTSITTANVAAAATVQAASIQASATVSAASINANAGIQVAKIGAQASLQRANMDFALATRQLDDKMALQGIDPNRFQNDPVYRQDTIAQRAIVQNAKDMLYVAEAADLIEGI